MKHVLFLYMCWNTNNLTKIPHAMPTSVRLLVELWPGLWSGSLSSHCDANTWLEWERLKRGYIRAVTPSGQGEDFGFLSVNILLFCFALACAVEYTLTFTASSTFWSIRLVWRCKYTSYSLHHELALTYIRKIKAGSAIWHIRGKTSLSNCIVQRFHAQQHYWNITRS